VPGIAYLLLSAIAQLKRTLEHNSSGASDALLKLAKAAQMRNVALSRPEIASNAASGAFLTQP
jgi:hypothetical protein